MDIIIYAQSLQNDATADILQNGVFLEKNTPIDLTNFDARNKVFTRPGRLGYNNKATGTKYVYRGRYLRIYVLSDEKDNIGRNSPIIIQVRFDDITKLEESLNNFLAKSGRHLSEEKKIEIVNAVEYTQKKHKNVRNIKIIVAALVVVFLAGIFLYLNTETRGKKNDCQQRECVGYQKK
jgi:hypothetical protein